MNGKMKKTAYGAMALALGFTVLSSGTLATVSYDKSVLAEDVSASQSTGKHERTISDTNDYIVQNGETDYKIVIPNDASLPINVAAEELVLFFQEATNIKLSVVTDAQIQTTEGLKCFSIGKTTLLENSKVNTSITYDLLGSDGYRMVTEENIIYIAGYGDYGSLYGVYDFLGDTLGYEFFYTDIYSLNKNVRELKLRNYDVTEVPDVGCRFYSWGFQAENKQTMNRQRVRMWSDYMIDVKNGRMWHNTVSGYIPVEKYGNPDDSANYHPNWYSNDALRRQMCYTARGDKGEYEALISCLGDTVVQLLEKNPTQSIITITQEDTPGWCTCESCNKETEKYGAASGMVLKLCNAVADDVSAKWKAKYGID